MRGCLIGYHVGAHSACLHPGEQVGEHISRIAQQAHRLGLAARCPIGNHRKCFIQSLSFGIYVSGSNAKIDPRLITFHRQTARPRHHRRQGLRAAHAAQTTRQNPTPRQIAIVMLAASLGKRLIGALHNALGADVNP